MKTLRLGRLPLFGKLLVPSLALTVFLGAFGAFLVVRDLSARAQAALERDLTKRTLDAHSLLRDRELYLLESANFAANLNGIAEAVQRGDAPNVAALLRSVLALKTDIDLLVVTDRLGVGVAEFTGEAPGDVRAGRGTTWADFVQRTLGAPHGRKVAGFITVEGEEMFAVASPVCRRVSGCEPVGTAIAGLGIREFTAAALGGLPTDTKDSELGAAVYDAAGRRLVSVGLDGAENHAPSLPSDRQLRRTRRVGSESISTLYSPLQLGEGIVGTLAVSLPTNPAFASVEEARLRLAVLLLAALAGAVALGAVITRLILRQVRPLVDTNRALGRGELSARAPVLSDDELGELARGVNQMAEQLQAIYQTLELRVAERTEEVRRLLRERTEFFASISHELRTPLAIIRGQATLLADSTYPKSERWTAETGKTIRGTTDQLLAVVNDILELAQAESGKMEINLEETNVAAVAKELKPTIVGLAKAGGINVKVDIPRDLPLVRADPGRLREIVVNLVDNAVKYTPPGGKIDVAANTNNGTVEISVSDTGIGIAPDVGDLIFEPFYRVEGAQPQGGQASTGLGLAIVKRLVEAQGGKIWFSRGPDTGTTFTFTLASAGARG